MGKRKKMLLILGTAVALLCVGIVFYVLVHTPTPPSFQPTQPLRLPLNSVPTNGTSSPYITVTVLNTS